MFNNSVFKKVYDEAYDVEIMLCHKPEGEAQEDLERRYKIVVMELLPVICGRVRACFFLLAVILGLLLSGIFK